MPFLIGEMKKHIDGYKDLTAHNEIMDFVADTVSIPLINGDVVINPLVKVGDKVKIGDIIGKRDDKFYVPVYSSVSGTVKAIEKRQTSSLKPVDHIIIENDHKDNKTEGKFLKEDASKEEIVSYMKEIGLCGLGGAGFPSYIKYSNDNCNTLLVNAVECEPYITSDYRNAELNLELLKQGVKFALRASSAQNVYVCIKQNKEDLIGKLKATFKDLSNVEIKTVPDEYPFGWERFLIRYLLKKEYDRLPIEVGVIVSNVSTLIELARSAKEGLPIYNKIVTVSGNGIENQKNIRCRIGTTFLDLVIACGGYVEDKVVLLDGGPMMGRSVSKDEVSVSLTTNCVLINKYEEYNTVKCLRCGRCSEYCPSGLQPVNIVTAYKAKDKDRLIKLKVSSCVECGMCSYVCPSKIDVTENIRRAKKIVGK